MSNVDDFNNDGYCYVKNALSKDVCSIATQYALFDEKFYYAAQDHQVKNSHSKYADKLTESILLFLQPTIEQNTGLTLLPTYSYYRVYRKNNLLDPHKDRSACEISASVCLGYLYPKNYDGWPLYVDDTPFYMEPGDMAVYKGEQINHYRYPFDVDDGFYQVQAFIHFVDANGPYKNLKYDKRPEFGYPKDQ